MENEFEEYIPDSEKEKITPIPKITQKEDIISIDKIVKEKSIKKDNLDEFSLEYNKLNEEEKILKMNPEIKRNVKIPNWFSKYGIILPIFAFLSTLFIGMYIFTNNIKADSSNLIRIELNKKVGYIDNEGNKIINPKYIFGTEFYNGYAIVKNQNDLFAIINNKDNYVVPFGIYYYIERFNDKYIVSKFTPNGLKSALLDSNLNEITKFKYDSITYSKNNIFIFVRNNTMGIINKEGKEIYKYESNDTDDKNISIELSKVYSDKEKSKYVKVTLNDSSTIINIKTGKKVYKYTLENLEALDNNIFYIKSNDNSYNKYFIIKNDKIIYQTSEYKRVRIDDYDSNILVCVKSDVTYDYINLKTGKKINIDDNYDYTYSNGILIRKTYDFTNDQNVYKFNDGKKEYEVKNINPVKDEFKNGFMRVFIDENKYNFINKKGELLNKEAYDTITNFNSNGYAIVSKDNNYGVINSEGKEIIKLKYENIEFIDNDLFESIKKKYNKELFIYISNGKKGIISSDSEEIKAIYNNIEFITSKYPFIKVKLDEENKLINIVKNKEYDFEFNDDIVINDNYFIINSKYYNYSGKIIFKGEE